MELVNLLTFKRTFGYGRLHEFELCCQFPFCLSVTTVTSIAFAIFPTVTVVTTIADDTPFSLLRFVGSLTLVTIISALPSANLSFCVSYAIIVIGVSFVTAIIPFSFVIFAAPIICYNFSYVLRHLLLLPILLRGLLLA